VHRVNTVDDRRDVGLQLTKTIHCLMGLNDMRAKASKDRAVTFAKVATSSMQNDCGRRRRTRGDECELPVGVDSPIKLIV
jgi:hypothetical protein